MRFASKLFVFNVYVIFWLFVRVYCDHSKQRPCENNEDCDSCLKELGCAWCLNPKLIKKDHGSVLSHCIPRTSDVECLPEHLIDPKTLVEVIRSVPLSNENESKMYLEPQQIRLHLRMGESYDLNFRYFHQPQDPVDLYYLMDNSLSMKQHKKQLANSGLDFAYRLRNITSNLRIGFGTFVDKVERPFVDTEEKRLQNPCISEKCIRPYSFINHVPLTREYVKFADNVAKIYSSGNVDSPEGGLDAIMQAIVCKAKIGWRLEGRHIIIFSTDASFHIAGDGKLAGIIDTNDAKCHMKNNHYDGLFNDYPSVSQLNYVAEANNMIIIFLIIVNTSEKTLTDYKFLSREIANSRCIRFQSFENVAEIFEEMINRVTIKHDANENLQVKITPHCKSPIKGGCLRLTRGEIVKFTANIKLLKCPDESREPMIISLKPNTIPDSLKVDLHPICKCET